MGYVAVVPVCNEAIATSTLGDFDGNMDYHGLAVGGTLILPGREPGSLLLTECQRWLAEQITVSTSEARPCCWGAPWNTTSPTLSTRVSPWSPRSARSCCKTANRQA